MGVSTVISTSEKTTTAIPLRLRGISSSMKEKERRKKKPAEREKNAMTIINTLGNEREIVILFVYLFHCLLTRISIVDLNDLIYRFLLSSSINIILIGSSRLNNQSMATSVGQRSPILCTDERDFQCKQLNQCFSMWKNNISLFMAPIHQSDSIRFSFASIKPPIVTIGDDRSVNKKASKTIYIANSDVWRNMIGCVISHRTFIGSSFTNLSELSH